MRHFHFRFFVLYFGAVLAVLLMLRGLLFITEPLFPSNNRWAKERVRGQLASLAQLARVTEDVVLFLGASEIEISFDPLAYDRFNLLDGKTTYSLNLAIRNNGTFLPLYFERIAEELERNHFKPKIIFVHFPVSRLTSKALSHFGELMKNHDLPAVYFEPSLWSRVPASHEDKVWLLINKWIFGERSLLQIPAMLDRFMYELKPNRGRSLTEVYVALNDSESNPKEAWNSASRGRFYSEQDQESPLIKSASRFKREPDNLRKRIRSHQFCCDFHDLNIDSEYANQVFKSLRRLRSLSDRIVIVDFREIPVYQRSNESAQNIDDFLRAAATAVDGEIIRIDLAPRMYLDLLHLSPAGTLPFARKLSESTSKDWLRH